MRELRNEMQPKSTGTYYFLISCTICVVLSLIVTFAIMQYRSKDFKTAAGVISGVDSTDLGYDVITAKYFVDEQKYELTEKVLRARKLRPLEGTTIYIKYEILQPAKASFASFSSQWMEGAVFLLAGLVGFSVLVCVAFFSPKRVAIPHKQA